MSTLRSIELLDVLSSKPAGPSVALANDCQMRIVSMPVCAASLRNLVRKRVKHHPMSAAIHKPASRRLGVQSRAVPD
jgi:hypothetical protein